jgi:hypothetical protein
MGGDCMNEEWFYCPKKQRDRRLLRQTIRTLELDINRGVFNDDNFYEDELEVGPEDKVHISKNEKGQYKVFIWRVSK